MEDPMKRFSAKEISKMNNEEYFKLLNEYNKYLRDKYDGEESSAKLIQEYNKLEEDVDINGSKVIYRNGEVHTILSDEINRRGLMSIEESRLLTQISVLKIYQMYKGKMK